MYSFGVLAYEVFALRVPFDTVRPQVLLYHEVGFNGLRLEMPDPSAAAAVAAAAGPGPAADVLRYPTAVDELVTSCFDEPDRRPTFTAVVQTLQRLEAACAAEAL